MTLARSARDYHERVIEPTRTTKHALSTVRALANSKERVPETLSRVRQRLDAVFEDAIFHGRCLSNPARAIRRKMAETLPSAKAGALAALPYREAPAFMEQLRAAQGVACRSMPRIRSADRLPDERGLARDLVGVRSSTSTPRCG